MRNCAKGHCILPVPCPKTWIWLLIVGCALFMDSGLAAVPKYKTPKFVGAARAVEEGPSPHGWEPPKDNECECIGVKSITLRYRNQGGHHTAKVMVYGHSEPDQFDHVADGKHITFFGTFGDTNLLGPVQVIVKLFQAYDAVYPFETQTLDVQCPDTLQEGDVFGSLEVVRVIKLQYTSDSPHAACASDECPFTLAVCVDTSASITLPAHGGHPSNEQIIKDVLKSDIVDYFAGHSVLFSLYTFATHAYEEFHYTSLQSQGAVDAAKRAVDAIAFQQSAPTWYTNWEDLFLLLAQRAPPGTGPDIVIFITDGNPTIHNLSPFVYGDYADDLAAGIAAAQELKESGSTKIVSVGVGEGVDVGNLQAVSGKDYVLAEGFEELQEAVDGCLPFLCCEEEKDACGVCKGDNSTCTGCDGIPNSGKEFDVCGECGGDGSMCAPPACRHETNVTVVQHTYFDIIAHENEGLFEFVYHTNYLPHSAVVLGFEPYTPCKLRDRGSCDNRVSDYTTDFCDLYTVDFPSGKWQREINELELKVYYRANFTIDELLYCTGPDGINHLINVSYDRSHYTGILYGAVVKPNNCYGNCDRIIFETHYNFEIWVKKDGVLSSLVMVSPVEVEAHWVRNIWLQEGDVIVEFETRVERVHGKITRLGDGELLVEQETGIPFHLVDSNVDCEDDGAQKCRQFWRIRSVNAIGVIDFSGFKPIRFTVFIGDVARLQVKVNLDLIIKRSSDPKVDTLLGANLALYHDRNLTVSHNNSFIDCSDVFALVYFRNSTVRIVLDKAFLCTGADGDPLPYDPSYPHCTGCNTPGIDLIIITLYDRDSSYVNDAFGFDFLHDPPSLPSQTAFKYTARAISPFKQLLQVHWKGELLHYGSNQGHQLIDGVAAGFTEKQGAVMHSLQQQISEHHQYRFHYPKQYYMSPVKNYESFSGLFGTDGRYIHHAASSVNFESYSVSCGYGSVWYRGACVNTLYSYGHAYGSNYYVWIGLLLIIVVAIVWYCFTVPSLPPHHDPLHGPHKPVHVGYGSNIYSPVDDRMPIHNSQYHNHHHDHYYNTTHDLS